MSSDFQSMSVEIRRMTAALRQHLPQPLDTRASFREMGEELRAMTVQLKHHHIESLSRRRPKVHKSMGACTDVAVSPMTPPESAKFYDWMNRRPAAR